MSYRLIFDEPDTSGSENKGVFDYRIRIWIHTESLWQADVTFIRNRK